MKTIRVLLIGGGASGGRGAGGGGGAGGYVYESSHEIEGGEYPVVVGVGGAAITTENQPGNAGGNSTFDGLTAYGGNIIWNCSYQKRTVSRISNPS